MTTKAKTKSKRVTFDLPIPLYRRLLRALNLARGDDSKIPRPTLSSLIRELVERGLS